MKCRYKVPACILLKSISDRYRPDRKPAWERICHTYEYVTDVLHMRTVVCIRNSYICVCVSHVDINTCANNTKSSHRIKLQWKIDSIGLCGPDVITKTYLYNFDPIKPHFYIVKLGFTRVYIIFLISAKTFRLWVLVRTASMFWAEIWKHIRIFIWKLPVFGGGIFYIFE